MSIVGKQIIAVPLDVVCRPTSAVYRTSNPAREGGTRKRRGRDVVGGRKEAWVSDRLDTMACIGLRHQRTNQKQGAGEWMVIGRTRPGAHQTEAEETLSSGAGGRRGRRQGRPGKGGVEASPPTDAQPARVRNPPFESSYPLAGSTSIGWPRR